MVDFGLIVREHQIVTKSFTIANSGTTEGGFILAAEPLPPLFNIFPCQGKLKPKEKVEIKVDWYWMNSTFPFSRHTRDQLIFSLHLVGISFILRAMNFIPKILYYNG